MIGKRIRLSKIINPISNRTCIVPMDHGITMGPIKGLTDTVDTLASIVKGGVDAVIVHKGLFMQLIDYPELMRECNFIMHLSASTSMSGNSNHKRLISSVERAIKMGAIGVSIHINLGCEDEGQMIYDMGIISDACLEWGMPLLAMMYVRGDKLDPLNVKNIAHAAKIAEELGADIVKVDCPICPFDMKQIVEAVKIPVIIAGGVKMTMEALIVRVGDALEAGAGGVSIGRNIFQENDPGAAVDIINNIVHGNLSSKEALAKLTPVLLKNNEKAIV
ncbi:MAG TPA: 2-amino-3,7-dideoxy-D-threo-hept-6-ulosonate synthase [Mobilitalea sp.]|nr:2-amino-3,7-dideoxy-D-threo-hept-6-ulosonate synthase [Mobilitalea sp.]